MDRRAAGLCGLCLAFTLSCDAGPTPGGGGADAARTSADETDGAGTAGSEARRRGSIGPTWRTVAVGADAAAIWDGAAWTASAIPAGVFGGGQAYYTDVAWSGSSLMAMGHTLGPPVVATSRDGVTWDCKGPIWFGESLEGLAWAGSTFVAVGTFDGYQAISFASADGTSPWSGPFYAPAGTRGFHGVAWNGSVLAASGEWNDSPPPWEALTGVVATSTDLVSWTVHPMPPPFARMTITATGGTFLATGVDAASGCVFGTSPDGRSWSVHLIANGAGCFAAATGDSEVVVLGKSSSGAVEAFVSEDGVTWEGPFSLPPLGEGAITWDGARYVTVARAASSSEETLSATSPDGRTWTDPVSVPLSPGGAARSVISFVVPPRVDATSPTSGLTAGGAPVRITGDFFQSGANVTFGGEPARHATVVDASTIWVVPPAHAPGAADVTVTNPDGQAATLQGAYVYSAPR